MRGTLVALRRDQASQVLVRPTRPRREAVGAACMSHNCDTCVVHAELDAHGREARPLRSRRRARRQSEHRQVHAVQRADGPQAAHRQLARQDGHRAEGGFEFNKVRYKLVDLPGTYSLLSASHDEEVARDFLLFGRPDVTVVVVDATALERNLNLVLQVLEITDRVVVAVNLMDEAKRKGHRRRHPQPLARSRRAGGRHRRAHRRRPARAARDGGRRVRPAPSRPSRCGSTGTPEFQRAVAELVPLIEAAAPGVPNARWIAIRLLDGDAQVEEALTTGRLADARQPTSRRPVERFSQKIALQGAQ